MIDCDTCMEGITETTIATDTHWWHKYVDKTHTKLDKEQAHEFTDFF